MSQPAACRMSSSWVRRGAKLADIRGACGRLIRNSTAFLVASRGIRNQQTVGWLRGFSQMICLLVNPRAPSGRAIYRKPRAHERILQRLFSTCAGGSQIVS
jgi:hypothetical protein